MLDERTAGQDWLRTEVESLLAQSSQLARLGPSLRDRLLRSTATVSEAASAEAEKAWVPQRAGKYLLFHPLARGGMAEVFLAKAIHTAGFERPVAVKRIHQSALGDATLRKYFAAEARLAGMLAHPNIVHVYDCEEHEGSILLVMELIQGVNLETVLNRLKATGAGLPRELAVVIARDLAAGLSYAHQRREDSTGAPLGIVHRDISPKNIMIDYEGVVKIVDFGIAKARHRARLTRTGMVMGTVGYLAPELLSGDTVDGRCDVHAACLVLYELLAGKRFYDHESPAVVMAQVRDAEFTASRLRELGDAGGLRPLIERGLAQNPDSRPTAGELWESLEAHLASQYPPGSSKRLREYLRALFAGERNELKALLERMNLARSEPSSKRESARARHLASGAGVFLTLLAALYWGKPRPRLPVRGPAAGAEGGCEVDAARYCPDDTWKSGLSLCLLRFEDRLTPSCRKHLSSFPCLKDRARFCPSSSPRETADCLRRRSPELSPECRRTLLNDL